jgi:hypothetical protein
MNERNRVAEGKMNVNKASDFKSEQEVTIRDERTDNG